LGVRIVRGRDFTDADRRGGPHVVLINETAARTFWPNEDPIGKPIAVGQGGFHVGSAEVIGIVSDVRFETLEDAPLADVFIPYLQAPRSASILYVRTAGRPESILPSLRSLIHELDPTMPVYDVRALSDRMALATFQPRYTTWVLGAFAVAALALAAVGIYALLGYEVAQRRREIGIRMALGAGSGTVVSTIVRRGLTLATVGVLIGIPMAIFLSRFLGTLLHGISPGDPATYVGITILLVSVAAMATVFPARAATRVNPMEAIRTE
jgi:predicted permease